MTSPTQIHGCASDHTRQPVLPLPWAWEWAGVRARGRRGNVLVHGGGERQSNFQSTMPEAHDWNVLTMIRPERTVDGWVLVMGNSIHRSFKTNYPCSVETKAGVAISHPLPANSIRLLISRSVWSAAASAPLSIAHNALHAHCPIARTQIVTKPILQIANSAGS